MSEGDGVYAGVPQPVHTPRHHRPRLAGHNLLLLKPATQHEHISPFQSSGWIIQFRKKKYKKIDVKKDATLFLLYEINEKNFERNHKMEIEIFSIASEKYKSWFEAKMGLTYTEFL